MDNRCFLERKKTFMKQPTEKITIDQVDNEGPTAGHSQWKLIHLKFIFAILKLKSITLGDDLEAGDGEGIQEDDSQVLGLRQQHCYDE